MKQIFIKKYKKYAEVLKIVQENVSQGFSIIKLNSYWSSLFLLKTFLQFLGVINNFNLERC